MIDPAITAFYTRHSEDSRLQIGLGPLEFERNKLLIGRYLQTNVLTVADVGGGTGHYAAWLCGLGHRVTLIDPVPQHIEQAKRKAKRNGNGFACLLGEARRLPLENASVDIVILHGPLYHLQERSDRLLALKEARRVLKPGGVMLGFAITHAASAVTALHSSMIHQPQIFSMCRSELLTGQHEPPDGMPGILPHAYFHRPRMLVDEVDEAGFTVTGLYAVEGLAWMDGQFFQSWADPTKRTRLLELVGLTESDRELLCFSPHMMVSASVNLGSSV